MSDGIKQASHRQSSDLAGDSVPQGEALHPRSSAYIIDLTVPVHGDGWVGHHPIGHGSTGSELVGAHDQMNMAAVLGEINRFFAGGITTTHHGQFFIAELGGGPITDRAGADATAPVAIL